MPDVYHFIAKLATDDTERVKRDIELHIEEQLHDAVGELYRRQTRVEFWAELREVIDEIGPERVFVLQVDNALQDVAEYAADNVRGRLHPRAGRHRLAPGFEWLDEQGIQPSVCLYFKDMECLSYPGSQPSFDVAWVSYGSPPSERNHEPWGERIDIGA